MNFAELFPRHAFVDLETTGLDPSRDEVIELGVLFVERGEVTRRVSRLFSASGPLPLAIQRITGIQDADLAGLPPFAEYLPKLQQSLEGYTVVAHNAGFEQSFLGELLRAIDAPVLDSMELLHYLYPELDSHALDSIIRWAGVGERAQHRALHDCEDTFAVLRYALARCAEEGRKEDVDELLACLGPGADGQALLEPASPLVALLRGLAAGCAQERPTLTLTATSSFLVGRPERLRHASLPSAGSPRPLAEPTGAEVVPVLDAEVDALLGPKGALEQTAEGFFSRPEQLQMARRLARTLSEGGRLAVEAGTGTGKSLAYLAPAVLFATKNQRRVGVAPHTKTLQDQLMEKDLPKLHRATGGAFSYAVLKGQTNYACRRRALEVTELEANLPYEARAPRAYLRAFLRRSPDGDLDRLSYWFKGKFPLLPALAAAARSEAATTLGERCPHFSRCFYHSAVAQAKEADVVVVNQALALAWPQRYPEISHLIVDEAHELEDVISTALAGELSAGVLARLMERLHGRAGRRGALSELRRAMGGAGVGGGLKTLLEEISLASGEIRDDAQGLGAALEALCSREEAGENDAPYALEVRLTPEVRATQKWSDVADALLDLQRGLDELGKLLSTRLEDVAPRLSEEHPGAARELAGAAAEVVELVSLVRELAEDPSPARCYSALTRAGHWQLTSQPIDTSKLFSEELAENKRALILTSATLSTGRERPWVLDRLGLRRAFGDQKPVELVRAATPFDLKSQALVILVTDAPPANDDAFLDWAATRIGGLAQFLGGRVLGLFASSRRLEEVGDRVRAQLEPMGIEVLRQSRGHGRSLAARQEQDAGSVLLGTKSFWQGVDIRGAGVACVFIDKLPIEPHTRPLVEAREERIEQGGRAAGFMQYRLPKALILLRQGVGRLIRSTLDKGVVVIADPGSATYRQEVLAALEGYRVEVLPWSQARVRLFQVLKGMSLHAQGPHRPAAATGERAPRPGAEDPLRHAVAPAAEEAPPAAPRLEPRPTLG